MHLTYEQKCCLAALILSDSPLFASGRSVAVLPLDPDGPYDDRSVGELFPLDPDWDPMPPSVSE